jgi:uncharacterized repeat protein (TIGR01451 family)
MKKVRKGIVFNSKREVFTMRRIIIKGILCIAMAMCFGADAFAIGTAAGTVISNQAYGDYKDANGADLPRVYSNTVTTTVNQVASVDVTPDTADKVGIPASDVAFNFVVHNYGNGTDTFDLAITDNTQGWTTKIYIDTDGDGIWDPGETTEATDTGAIAADGIKSFFVVTTIPGATPNDTVNVVTVKATSQFDPSVEDSSVFTATVANATMSISKYVSYTDAAVIPGTVLTYKVEGANDGSANATGIYVEDIIPANSTYVPGSMKVGAPASAGYNDPLNMVLTDANDGDEGGGIGGYWNSGSGRLEMDWPVCASGGVCGALYFQVTVNANTPSGTVIENYTTASFQIEGVGPTYSETSNTASVTVTTLPNVDISTAVATKYANPGDTVSFAVSVCNYGNAADVIDFSIASGSSWTYELWVDVDGNGIPGTGADYLLTDTDGDGKIDTGSLNQNVCLTAIAVVTTVPSGSPDGYTEIATVTLTSSNDTGITDTQNLTIIVTAPILLLTKSVSPLGPQNPGATLTYTILAKNIGTGQMTGLIVSDHIPAHTTYVPNSILTGAAVGTLVAKTDAIDLDGAHFNTGNNAIEAGAVNGVAKTLAANAEYVVRFSVVID